MFFFFKQKTAYEMRISDWSSDVCSSDLHLDPVVRLAADILVEARQMAAHFERNHREGEKEPVPEAPLHIVIFFAGAVRCCRHDGLECHAADRAASGAGALDLDRKSTPLTSSHS